MVVAVTVTSVFATSACGFGGGDDTVDPATATTTPVDVADGADASTDESDQATSESTSIAGLEAAWADRRAELVAMAEANGWGLDEDGEVVSGPGGWEIELDDCPAGWDDLAGVDDGRITIAQTLALSGALGAYGDFGIGMRIYFDHVNRNGGIDGVQIDYVLKDDEYDAERTVDLIDDLIDADAPPFAISTLGTPNSLAVYDEINDACIPHPFVMSGHPAWGDARYHPWTTGSQLSFSTEAILWGRWLKQNLPAELPVKVAALVIDNDFGQVYQDSFADWADDNSDVVTEFLAVTHTPTSRSFAEQWEEIVEFDPDVFISMTSGEPCLAAVTGAAEAGLTESTLVQFVPSVCKDPFRYMIPAGSLANDFMVVGGGLKSSTDPQYASEPFVAFINEQIAEAGHDPANGLIGTGAGFFAWSHVEALRLASELPGGLRRSNLALATRLLDVQHPMMLDGIRFATEGNYDSFFVEGSEFARFDSSVQSWVQDGRVIDVNGVSPSCRWSQNECA